MAASDLLSPEQERVRRMHDVPVPVRVGDPDDRSRSAHPTRLREQGAGVVDVLQDSTHEHGVEGVGGEGEMVRIRGRDGHVGALGGRGVEVDPDGHRGMYGRREALGDGSRA